MATTLIVLSLIGAVLGMRYSVLSLVPVTLAIWLVLLVVGWETDTPMDRMALDGLVAALVMQAGFFVGTMTKHLLVVARARKTSLSGDRVPVPDL
ncbi:hypothetical protein [Rhodoplanes roseus]|uniref:Uncharacterized protein n=1 Tax=Rhodoplanes roseus TaxID=29409 RepID=A0A327KXR0_9BRAD|nr:hypothetical protein [Rhodoplanes roseus]RAI43670.1 hypothetical protein CH341_13190 [Rhodoplanes roseus]